MENKVIIVTGGSRGIGAQIVKNLANENTKIILNYNNSEQKAKQIKQELEEKNIFIDIFKADVKDRKQVREMIDYTIKKYGKIDVLINNAGISEQRLFTDVSSQEWQKMINVNMSAAFYTTQECVKNMISNKNGCIINISSIWGEVGGSCEVHYSVAKAGLDGMTKALAKELGPSNIRVNSIAPGIINTEMNNNLNNIEKEEIINKIPLLKIGDELAIVNCIKWLIQDDYTTGQVISINGGWKI